MVGVREAGALGASLAMAGGVAYLIWNYMSSSRVRGPEKDGGRREEQREVERQEEQQEVKRQEGRREEQQQEEEQQEEEQQERERQEELREEQQEVERREEQQHEEEQQEVERQEEQQEVERREEQREEERREEEQLLERERREEQEVERQEEPERSEEAPQPAASAEVQKTSSASQDAESEGTQVLVLGLDGAGKTSLVQCFTIGGLEHDTMPTQGFNAVSINRDNVHIEFLEIGGRDDLRLYWPRYLYKALLLVFVVDSADRQRFPLAKAHLHKLLASRPHLPLMVLANKQDLPGACSITDLHDALCLSDLGDRQLCLIGTHVKKGDAELSSGVQDAQQLIIHMVCGD